MADVDRRRATARWLGAALLGLALRGLTAPAGTGGVVVEVHADRAFGQTVGGIVSQTIVVDLPPGPAASVEHAPQRGAVSEWLDLVAIDWSEPSENRIELHLDYLILKGVRVPEPVTTPGFTLSLRRGGKTEIVDIPAWPFTLLPVIPPAQADDQIEVRPPLPAKPNELGDHVRVLSGILLGVLVCTTWLVLHVRLSSARGHSRPFRRAMREIRKSRHADSSLAGYTEALRAVHRSIDETAGRTVCAADIDALLADRPAFSPLGAGFAWFFVESERCFFGADTEDTSLTDRWNELERFCERCLAAEIDSR